MGCSGPFRAALLALLAPGVAGGQAADRWIDVELPAGFHLDLTTGEVTNRPKPDSPGTLAWSDGSLLVTPRLAALAELPRPAAERVSALVRRGAGRPVEAFVPRPGDELLFDLSPDLWGYLRVLEVSGGSVRLELARAQDGADLLRRDPSQLALEAGPGAFHLHWPAAAPDARYVVMRRTLGGARTPEPDPLVRLAEVVGGEWDDPHPPASALVEYRVARAGSPDRPGEFGSRARAVRVVHPGEWLLPLVRGLRVDLLTGAVGSAGADVEIVYAEAPSVALRPLDGTLLALGGKRSWELPPLEGEHYAGKARTVLLESELAAYLKEGVFLRITFEVGPDGAVALRRQVDLYGGRRLPVAPELPQVSWGAEGLVFDFPPIAGAGRDGQGVHLVAERELGYRRGDWEEVAAGPPGGRVLALPVHPPSAGSPPLTRFRFRHRQPWGPSSFPTESLPVLLGDRSDPEQVETWLVAAFDDLTHPEFERRIAARGVLENLGESALPRLEAALRSGDPELAAAARDILIVTASTGGGHVELILRARAIGEGVDAPPPAGIFDPLPGRRAWALLTEDRGGDPGARAWRRIVALADPDEGVARMAELLERMPPSPGPAPAGEPLALWPPEERLRPAPPNWRRLSAEIGPRELARAARAAADPSEPDVARVRLQVAHLLQGDGGSRSPRPADVEAAELALRLVERHRTTGRDLFLQAAAALVDRPAARLAALRELLELRLAHVAPDPPARRRVELAEPSLAELEGRLASLVSEGARYVDLVLPPGDYGLDARSEDSWVDLRVSGLRLIGGEGVVLRAGLRVAQAEDVVLEGLVVENTRGSALHLTLAGVLVRDCRLIGAQTTVLVDRSRLELDGVECGTDERHRGTQWSVRLAGGSSLTAVGSFFPAGTVATGPEGRLYLDRCVLDAEARTAIQSQRGATVVLRDTLVRSREVGASGVGEGLAVGVVFDTLREPVGRGPTGLRLCPELVEVTDRTPELDPGLFLESCPLR